MLLTIVPYDSLIRNEESNNPPRNGLTNRVSFSPGTSSDPVSGSKPAATQVAHNPSENMGTRIRNWIGFWLLGLCNNYAYVIMLSAAHDLLSHEFQTDVPTDPSNHTQVSNSTNHCNAMSTGMILLADILPSLFTKAISPFILEDTKIRVMITITLSALSFIITSTSVSDLMSFAGVVCASISSGLGEVTFLAYSASFDKRVVSGWSSGTGAAGLVGAGVYLILCWIITPRTVLLIQLVIPVIMIITFWFLIVHPRSGSAELQSVATRKIFGSSETVPIVDLDRSTITLSQSVETKLTFREKINVVKPLLLRFMLPLMLVYFFEYFINQGLFELVYFKNVSITQDAQYRLYNTLYQVGVFISRSSVQFIQIKLLWMMPILQSINFMLFLSDVINPYFGHISVAIIIILFEGLLGGAAYVNTFYRISSETIEREKAFAMSIVSLADSFGILLAGLIAIPVHDALCSINSQNS